MRSECPLIYTAEIMKIRGILHGRVYFSLTLIYLISVAALCSHAPAVQQIKPPQSLHWLDSDHPITAAQPVQLSPDDVEIAPEANQATHRRAPLWTLGGDLALNAPLFAAEQVELIALTLIVGLAYRFRVWLLRRGSAIMGFVAVRRRGTCIWLAFAVVLILSLFPPWAQINTYGGRYPAQRVELWHARIDRAPIETTRRRSSVVDYARMLTEIAAGECFVLALYLTWARTKPTANSKS